MYVDIICAPGKDTHFYMGNMKAHPGAFLVLGAFYPKVSDKPTLFEFEELDPAVRTEVAAKPAAPSPGPDLFSE